MIVFVVCWSFSLNFSFQQKSANNFVTKAFNSGIAEAEAASHFNEIKTMIGGLRAKIPQDVFEPFDLLNQMINNYKQIGRAHV